MAIAANLVLPPSSSSKLSRISGRLQKNWSSFFFSLFLCVLRPASSAPHFDIIMTIFTQPFATTPARSQVISGAKRTPPPSVVRTGRRAVFHFLTPARPSRPLLLHREGKCSSVYKLIVAGTLLYVIFH